MIDGHTLLFGYPLWQYLAGVIIGPGLILAYALGLSAVALLTRACAWVLRLAFRR